MSRIRAYAQLVRLPNVFTALADICLGALVAGTTDVPRMAFVCVLLASACLYSGGMVWNDFFDVEQDRRERPFRPLPSGRISRLCRAFRHAAPGCRSCLGRRLCGANRRGISRGSYSVDGWANCGHSALQRLVETDMDWSARDGAVPKS